MTFTSDDLDALVAAVVDAWRAGAGGDWSAAAGSLDWSCARTADHAVDTVLAPAFFLASRKQDGYPPGEPFTIGPDPTVDQLVDALVTAARILRAVVETTPDDVTATIWFGEVRGRADFVPRAGLELALHRTTSAPASACPSPRRRPSPRACATTCATGRSGRSAAGPPSR